MSPNSRLQQHRVASPTAESVSRCRSRREPHACNREPAPIARSGVISPRRRRIAPPFGAVVSRADAIRGRRSMRRPDGRGRTCRRCPELAAGPRHADSRRALPHSWTRPRKRRCAAESAWYATSRAHVARRELAALQTKRRCVVERQQVRGALVGNLVRHVPREWVRRV